MTASMRQLLLTWLTAIALSCISPALGLALLGFSVVKFMPAYREVGQHVQASPSLGRYGLSMGLFLFVVYWLIQVPAPSDDLLRHIPAYAYGYSHRAIFPHSTLPEANLYPAFELAVGTMAQAWGPLVTVQFVMAFAWALALLLAWGLAHSSGARLSAGTSILLCLLFTTPLAERLFLGRPEVFGVLWALSAWLCKGRYSKLAWLAGGMLFSASYWLFPLYLVSIVLLPAQRKTQFLMAIVLGLFHVGFWSWHVGGLMAYVDIIRLIPEWTRSRMLGVSETNSIWQMFARPSLVALTLLGLTGMKYLNKQQRLAIGVVAVAVLMTNMVRYAAVFALLMFIASLPLVPILNDWARKHVAAAVFVLLAPVFAAGLASQAATTFSKLPQFKLPAASRVLTTFDSATFSLPFFNPGKVQITPAMEVGATAAPYQAASKALSSGNLTCSQLEKLDITHVVEDNLWRQLPCLKLVDIQGGWRLWEVSHGR